MSDELAKRGIAVRRYTDDDVAFIYSTMLNALWDETRDIRAKVFDVEQRRVISRLLAESLTLIGCLADDPSVIICYGIFGPQVIHFVYVKGVFRRQGIGESFVKECLGDTSGFYSTHLTKKGRKLWNKLNLTHNPYLLMSLGDEAGHLAQLTRLQRFDQQKALSI